MALIILTESIDIQIIKIFFLIKKGKGIFEARVYKKGGGEAWRQRKKIKL